MPDWDGVLIPRSLAVLDDIQVVAGKARLKLRPYKPRLFIISRHFIIDNSIPFDADTRQWRAFWYTHPDHPILLHADRSRWRGRNIKFRAGFSLQKRAGFVTIG